MSSCAGQRVAAAYPESQPYPDRPALQCQAQHQAEEGSHKLKGQTHKFKQLKGITSAGALLYSNVGKASTLQNDASITLGKAYFTVSRADLLLEWRCKTRNHTERIKDHRTKKNPFGVLGFRV